MKKTQLLKKTSVPKRKNGWKRLLCLKENTFEKRKKVQNKVKKTFEKDFCKKKTGSVLLQLKDKQIETWKRIKSKFEKDFCN